MSNPYGPYWPRDYKKRNSSIGNLRDCVTTTGGSDGTVYSGVPWIHLSQWDTEVSHWWDAGRSCLYRGVHCCLTRDNARDFFVGRWRRRFPQFYYYLCGIIRLHWMHEMLPIVTDVRLSVRQSVSLSVTNAPNDPAQQSGLETRLCCTVSFGAAFAKPLWPLVFSCVCMCTYACLYCLGSNCWMPYPRNFIFGI